MSSRNPFWYSSTEAAQRLGITPRTLYRLIDRRELPGYRIGRVIRIKREDVDAFIEHARLNPRRPKPG